MARVGLELVREAPLLGTGPGQLRSAYAALRPSRPQPHLHNNLLQIAAERGLLALVAWLLGIAALALHLARRWRAAPQAAAAAGGLGALAAVLVAGAFEYNFGDSEVLTSLLLVVAVGCAGPAGPDSAPAPTSAIEPS
jgi:O-antigen ligase